MNTIKLAKMKKTMTDFLRKAGLSLATATVALCGMTSCSGDDDNTSEQPIEQSGVPEGYTVCIHATMDDGDTRAVSFDADGVNCTSTFSAEDRVYVYNRGGGGHSAEMLKGYLTPTNISADGKSCDLVGTIQGGFYMSNKLLLAYNLNRYNENSYSWAPDFYFDYETQTGAASTVIDGAIAEVGISDYIPIQNSFDEIPVITDVATFQNVQSMFRQRLTFKDAHNNTVIPTITSLRIQSTYRLNNQYYPMQANDQGATAGDKCVDGGITINNPFIDSNGDIYLSLRFASTQPPVALKCVAKDNAQNYYEIIKSAPEDGFKNGKYYHGSMTLPYVRHLPTVTGTSAKDDYHNRFFVNENPANITISGTSEGFYFFLNEGGTVTFSNLNATYNGQDPWDDNYYNFLYSRVGLNIILDGDNSITCMDKDVCINSSQSGPMKLSGNGTLKVTAKGILAGGYCGIYSDYNYNGFHNQSNTTDEIDVSTQLAADGYTVTRSARKDNGNYCYTWTYTVKPIQQ